MSEKGLFTEQVKNLGMVFGELQPQSQRAKVLLDDSWKNGLPHVHERQLFSAWLRFSEIKGAGGKLEIRQAWAYLKLLEWIQSLSFKMVVNSSSERREIPLLLSRLELREQAEWLTDHSQTSWTDQKEDRLMDFARQNVLTIAESGLTKFGNIRDLYRIEEDLSRQALIDQ